MLEGKGLPGQYTAGPCVYSGRVAAYVDGRGAPT